MHFTLIYNERNSFFVCLYVYKSICNVIFRFDRQASVPTSPYHSHPDSGPPSGTFQPFSDMVGTDDIFTASLSMSDSDRRFDAWIPSDATRHILLTMATSTGLFIPTSEQLSTPGVLSNEPLVKIDPKSCLSGFN